MADVIYNRENHTNYYSLYEYLLSIKEDIEKLLKKEWFTQKNSPKRFDLKLSDWEINISTVVPNYNYLYSTTGGIFTQLANKSFIEKISIDSYKSTDFGVFFNMKIKTK